MTRSAPSPRFLLLVVALIASVAGCAPALARTSAEPTTVVVVRHAERASETDRDSPLSPAGETRSRALADALADAGISTVITTQYQRTRNTARPLAERLGLQIQVEESGSDAQQSVAALAQRIRARHVGETVLVVGHSNTVPLIVRALGGADVGELQSGDYDNLFVVVIPAQGPVRTLRTRYGAPDGR